MTQKRKNTDGDEAPSKKTKPNSPPPDLPSKVIRKTPAVVARPRDSVSRSTRSKSKSVTLPVDSEDTPMPEPTAETRTNDTKPSDKDDEDNGCPFEILDGDFRTPILRVGKPEPKRLTLRLRNKATGMDESHTFTSKAASEVDWNDKADVKKINDWRRQLFNRKGFANVQHKNKWTAEEKAYLELMYQKLSDAASTKGHQALPHTKSVIFDAFNNFFNDNREDVTDENGNELEKLGYRGWDSFESHVRRKGTVVGGLYGSLKDRLTDKSADAWVPDITNEEIKAHLAKGQTGGKAKSRLPASGNTGATDETPEGAVGTEASKDKAKRKTSSKVTSSSLSNSGAKPAGKPSSRSKPLKEKAQPTLTSGETAIMSGPMRPGDNTGKPPGTQSADGGQHSNPASKETTHISSTPRSHSGPRVTTKEEFAKLREEGWSFPDLPKSDDEAFRRHRETQQKVKGVEEWAVSADLALDDRLKRMPVIDGRLGREVWSRDLKPERKQVKMETTPIGEELRMGGRRHDAAASVNAILNHANIPPLGFQGDIHTLGDDPRLHQSERFVVQVSADARKKLHGEFDKFYEESGGNDEKEPEDAGEPKTTGSRK